MEKTTIYILGNYRVGAADGLAEFNYQTVRVLKNDFDFHFIEFDNCKDKYHYNDHNEDGFTIHLFGIKNISSFNYSPLFKSWLQQLKSDKVLFHLSHIYNLRNYNIAKLLVKFNIRYIITPHDSFVYADSYQNKMPFLKRIYRRWFIKTFDKYVFDHAVLIHGISKQCSLCIRGLTNTQILVVSNQVKDINIPFDFEAIKDQVCFIGRFDIYRKGIDIALQAFSIFKQKIKDKTGFQYLLIGPADKRALNEVNKICSDMKLNIPEDVVLPGKLPELERNNNLAASKIYMQLSRTEGFGLSIAQALSCFKPVIISKEIPINDTIAFHNAGFVVNNAKEAAVAMEKIINLSEEAYLKLAYNARNCYEKEFHPSIIKPLLLNLYNTALAT